MMKEQIIKVTQSLIENVTILEIKFNDEEIVPEHGSDFFNYVKNDSEQVFSLLNEWVLTLTELVDKGSPVIVQPIIDSTKDNMNALIMHSYYKDVRRRRYMEINRSCIYTFNSVLKELADE